MKKGFLTIKKDVANETVIERSRFICTLKRVDGEDEAKAFVTFIKSTYPDANHNCYAYIADEGGFYVKFSDDGEPQGTAGLPMLETLKAMGLKKVAAVVTRYFGGIKLGTGGLARAYSDGVKQAVLKSGISECLYSVTLKTSVSYSLYPKILKILEKEQNVKKLEEYTADGVDVTITVPVERKEDLAVEIRDLSAGKSTLNEVEKGYFEY
ncbi:MAG: YigZ family protein [Clostridia bacterium]|nr:YigZ family protein [Clostridia bacterium]